MKSHAALGRLTRWTAWLVAAALIVGGGACAGEAATMPVLAVGLELTLGLKDKQPTDWSGSITVSQGKVVSLVQLPGGRALSGGRWKLSTQSPRRRFGKRKGKAKGARPVQLRAALDAPPSAAVRVATPRGEIAFKLEEIPLGSQKLFLSGAVSVRRTLPAWPLTRTATDDDFPAAAVAPDGSVWCAYTSYQRGTPVNQDAVRKGQFDSLIPKGNGDQVKLMRFTDGRWSLPINVTEPGLDVQRPAVAVGGDGRVWVFWSQNGVGGWDIYARNYDPAKQAWSKVARLTHGPGTDAHVVAAAAKDGAAVWIAWQGWRSGNFDILVARVTAGAAAQEQRVSTSAANDWHPAISVAPNGDVWVAWDTYDRGSYDVLARRLSGGTLGAPIPVATGPRFEARPSLAVDKQGRVWVAFEDAGANWGKDYGPRLTGKGVPFYYERNILVRCIAAGTVLKTKAAPRSELINTHYDDRRYKNEMKQRISFPRLGFDGTGRLWLLYRRHPLTNARGEQWISCATHLDGARWAPEVRLPSSANLLDNRPALAALGDAGLLAVYSSDQRTSARSAKVCDLHATVLRADTAPAEAALVAAAQDRGKDTVPVHPREAEQIRRLRGYRITVGGKTYRLARGEFHRHTEISSHRDWDGSLEAVWRYGHDVADMDWIGPGDHDYGMGHDYVWWIAQKQIDLMHHAPELVTLFTYERSLPYPSGHRNIMFAKRGIRCVPKLPGREPLFGTPEKGSADIRNLYAFLKHFEGICSSHTSATNMGTDWRDGDPTLEPVVEIFQGHRQSYEETNAPLAARNAGDSIQGYRPAGFVWEAFKKGRRMGFQSSSDHVSTHTSYGIVLVEELSRKGIVAAFKKRHCYAANDNILLDVRCGDAVMGDEITLSEPAKLDVFVHATAPITRVDIVRQVGRQTPAYVYNLAPNKEQVRFQWTDRAVQKGQVHMYYVRIQQRDQRLAWASPIWVTYR